LRISLVDTFSFFQVEQQVILRSVPATQQGVEAEGLQEDGAVHLPINFNNLFLVVLSS
jgi:hypothetical protein